MFRRVTDGYGTIACDWYFPGRNEFTFRVYSGDKCSKNSSTDEVTKLAELTGVQLPQVLPDEEIQLKLRPGVGKLKLQLVQLLPFRTSSFEVASACLEKDYTP